MKRSVDGYAMPVVLVVSAVVLLLILFAYDSLSLKLKRYAMYNESQQERANLTSAMNLYLHDSLLCAAGDSVELRLFGADSVHISVSEWGLYERVCISNRSADALQMLVGRREECPEAAALWVCDRNRPLSLAGEVKVDGVACIPVSGLNYTDAGTGYYSAVPLPEANLRLSEAELPRLDSLQYARACGLCSSWKSSSKTDGVTLCRENVSLSGQGVLKRDAIVSARSVRVCGDFVGSVQIFASDTVIVDCGAVLMPPSGIFVGASKNRPYVELRSGSEVSGYVVVTAETQDHALRFPALVQEKGSKVRGLMYIDGLCRLGGSIDGAAYIRDCFHSDGLNIFPGTLCDTRITRSDTLAFPILLAGSYTRKPLKKIYD